MTQRKTPRRTADSLGKWARSATQHEALVRTFGDLEVRDAEADLRVPIIAEDIAKAERKNPERCALAIACHREFHSSAAVFFKSVAYVDILGEDGVRRVERFIVNGRARALIEAFDRGEEFPAGGQWLVLRKPTPSNTLDSALQAQRRRAQRRRLNVRKGEIEAPKNGQSTRHKRQMSRDLEVRNGQGLWQMIRAKETEKKK